MDDQVYQKVLETIQDGILLVGPSGTIQAVNPAFEQMTGYRSQDLVGKNCRVLNCTGCKVFAKGSGEKWCALFKQGGVRDNRCDISGKSGQSVHVIKHAAMLRDADGKPMGAVESFTDVTRMVEQEQELKRLRSTLAHQSGMFGIIGSSEPVRRLLDLVANVAHSEAPVWIHGESGVGKELVARAVHEAGPRAGKPFIEVNCASLNEHLLESELFGHVKGAFTGADRDREGRFEAASGGSLFLDEIGDMAPSTQVKLLRVLEAGKIERVGSHQPIAVDVRVVTATNRDLEDLVARGEFREDLFYRINVFPITVLPLRERCEDIPELCEAFIQRLADRTGKPIRALSPAAMEIFMQYSWPGNIRELLNALEYAFVICRGEIIETRHLPPRILKAAGGEAVVCRPAAGGNGEGSASYAKGKQEMIDALEKAGGNRTRAAEALGVSRVTVWKRMKKYGLLGE